MKSVHDQLLVQLSSCMGSCSTSLWSVEGMEREWYSKPSQWNAIDLLYLPSLCSVSPETQKQGGCFRLRFCAAVLRWLA